MSRYRKKIGFVPVKIKTIFPHFVDGICIKSGRVITFQFKRKLSDSLRDMLTDMKKKDRVVTVRCTPHEEEDFYWFSGIAPFWKISARQKQVGTYIAKEALDRECEKDLNPVHTGSIKQSLILGRAGLPTSRNTSGAIGGALIRNIDMSKENAVALKRVAIKKLRKERNIIIMSQRKRTRKLEEEYYEWLGKGKQLKHRVKALEDNDTNWTKFLAIQDDEGSFVRQKMMNNYKIDGERLKQIEEQEKEFEQMLKEARL